MVLKILEAAWMAWVGLTAISTAEVRYPDDAAAGGTVVAALHLSAGRVTQVEILSGEEPFTPSAQSALARWRFSPDTQEPSVLVVVHFRHRNIYDVGPSERVLRPRRQEQSLPFPTTVRNPAYPIRFVGRGCVVLKVSLDAEGSPSFLEPLTKAGPLTEASVRAVNAWRFTPARDAQGEKTSSEIYVVCVFHELILAPQRP